MGRQALERKLNALEALRHAPASPETAERLAKALRDRNNYAVAKAAELASTLQLPGVIPILLDAFERFLRDGAKSDPQCWAKIAIAKALAALGHDNAEFFLRGLKCIQMEPVWGGHADTAAAVRGACAAALPGCRIPAPQLLQQLVDALADPDRTVRVEAVRSIACTGDQASVLLLRLKALAGDADAEVTGQCLSSLLDLAARESVAFVARFLNQADPELRAEAAAALAQAPDPAAIEALSSHWHREEDAGLKRALLGFLGGAVLPEAAAFLWSVLENDTGYAADALGALASSRFRRLYESRAVALVSSRGDARLDQVFRDRFGHPGDSNL